MKRYTRHILNIMLGSLLLAGGTSCVDDLNTDGFLQEEGAGMVEMQLTFRPAESAELGTRTPGNAISDIRDLYIGFYDEFGNYIDHTYYPDVAGSSEVSVDWANTGNAKEDPVRRVTFRKKLEYGKYRIYAAANLGRDISSEARTIKDLMNIQLTWDKNAVSANAEMAGYFHTSEEKVPAMGDADTWSRSLININSSTGTLHAWLRRASSKVTVSFNTDGMNDDVYIYLKSVQIKDIPAHCTLMSEYPAVAEDIPAEGKAIQLIKDGEMAVYGEGDYTNYRNWPMLARSTNDYVNSFPEGTSPHDANAANSLFFYENLQGKGKDKAQIAPEATDTSRPTYPEGNNEGNEYWKDKKQYGTWIEVKGFYVSNAENNVGKGQITYRFMLGKNIKDDYNAERNNHYKLTLNFVGNANEVDWHIDYEEEDKPGIYMPDAYVSYLYNQPNVYNDMSSGDLASYEEKLYPIRIAGKDIGKNVTVRIVENNWAPNNPEPSYTYWRGKVATSQSPAINFSGVWHGFLSLYKQEGDKSVATTNRFGDDEYRYWYSRGQRTTTKSPINTTYPTDLSEAAFEKYNFNGNDHFNYGEGYRVYDISTPGYKTDSKYGDYKVVHSVEEGEKIVTLYIPLFTRPLIINPGKSFSGNNNFFSYQRTAKLKIDVDLKANETGSMRTVTSFANVTQVRRIINPKGIFRSAENTSPFEVNLMYRTGETGDYDFIHFPSMGKWRARIVRGEGWEIVGAPAGVIEGGTGSNIVFTVKPKGKLAAGQVKSALVKVEYHGFKCVHYIHLRQGYDPIRLVPGGAKWHSYNLLYATGTQSVGATLNGVESNTPLEEGSLFRYGNLHQGIDAINNYNNINNVDINGAAGEQINGYVYPARWSSAGIGNYFLMSPVEGKTLAQTTKKAWASVTANPKGWNYPFSSSNVTVRVNGKVCRLPSYNDFNALLQNDDISTGFGLCYMDGASSNYQSAGDDIAAFRYSWFAKADPTKGGGNWTKTNTFGQDTKGSWGARATFVYNQATADVVMFPMGNSGFGRRKGNSSSTLSAGRIRYGDFDSVAEAESYIVKNGYNYAPMLYTLCNSYGALYWLSDRQTVAGASTPAVAWDFNYSTLDFGPMWASNVHVKDKATFNQSDALFIRLVED